MNEEKIHEREENPVPEISDGVRKKHDRNCWCPNCFWWKMECPEIMDETETIEDNELCGGK